MEFSVGELLKSLLAESPKRVLLYLSPFPLASLFLRFHTGMKLCDGSCLFLTDLFRLASY